MQKPPICGRLVPTCLSHSHTSYIIFSESVRQSKCCMGPQHGARPRLTSPSGDLTFLWKTHPIFRVNHPQTSLFSIANSEIARGYCQENIKRKHNSSEVFSHFDAIGCRDFPAIQSSPPSTSAQSPARDRWEPTWPPHRAARSLPPA